MRISRFCFYASVASIYVFILAPLFCVIAVSVNEASVPAFPPTQFSLKWYVNALTLDRFRDAAWVSFWLAAVATLISTPLAILAAVGLARTRLPGRHVIEAMFLAPLVVPGLIIGIAILIALAAQEIREAPVRLLLAHVLMVFPYTVRTVLASLQGVDRSIEEAAQTLGASPTRAFMLTVFPLLWPGVAAGMIFSFILSFDDVVVSLFLIDARTATLPLAIMSYLEYNVDPTVAAVSSLLVFFTLLLTIVLERIIGLKRLFGG